MAITDTAAFEDHFDSGAFDAEIEAHGTPVLWRRAITCPCVDPTTGRAQVDCAFCEVGYGVIWEDVCAIKVLAPGRQRHDKQDDIGMWMEGMTTFTFPSSITPGHLDRIGLTAARMVINNERHERGAVDKLGRSRERTRLRPVYALEDCRAIVDGTLHRYRAPEHLVIDQTTGVIDWQDGPPEGVQYTLRYLAQPEYVLWSPMSRDEHAARMPYRVMAQRLDFFRNPSVGEAVQ